MECFHPRQAVHQSCARPLEPDGKGEVRTLCVSVRKLEWGSSDFCHSSIGQVTSKAAEAPFFLLQRLSETLKFYCVLINVFYCVLINVLFFLAGQSNSQCRVYWDCIVFFYNVSVCQEFQCCNWSIYHCIFLGICSISQFHHFFFFFLFYLNTRK